MPRAPADARKSGSSSCRASTRDSTSDAPRAATCSVQGASAARSSGASGRRYAGQARRRSSPAVASADGNNRASDRSKYARRAAGPLLTIARRSGVKTSVAVSVRSCSAARRRAPFTSARLPSAVDSATPIWTGASPRVPSTRIRAARSPNRIKLRIRAGARREALGADVERLEQVRLPGTVRADREHEARLE